MSGSSYDNGGGGHRSSGAGEQFSVKPWEMHGEGREFETISNDFARAALALEQSLGGLGTPWGTDEPGSGFASEYQEAHRTVLGGLNGIADALGRIGTGLHTMADSVADTDAGITADFGRTATPGGPGAVRSGGAPAGMAL
ncbi:WXG100 family type VII secretion target [Kitasatospora sp. NBC_00315]|uniref:WXG100 family type VII secretion target n=1 Tax=Kitasatospora sp. NBC_00315 TaxID=2975963 RepID=UPI00324B93D1